MALTRYEINKRWRERNPEVWRTGLKRYRNKSRLTAYNSKQNWTIEDCIMVTFKTHPDGILAKKIGRSICAIQSMRLRLKKRI
jgi:hypothetical protein